LVSLSRLRADDDRQDRLISLCVGNEHHHVGQELHRHDRAHIGRGERDRHLARQLDTVGALDELHGDLRVLANQVQRPLMRD
jgi:hypothetical protein